MRGVKRSKFGNVKTVVDGITFDSAKEARRYQELLLLEKAGRIHRIHCQFKMRLCVWNTCVQNEHLDDSKRMPPCIGHYVADFAYCEHDHGVHAAGTCVVEDVKGFRTPMYRWKKKHVEAQYGITIRET